MDYLIAFSALFSIAAIWFLWLYITSRQQKNNRVQLRLLVGRSGLLKEEIKRHTAILESLDTQTLKAAHQQFHRALDTLQMFLIERQTYLQNQEDLGHLQRTKIALQEIQVQSLAYDLVQECSSETTTSTDREPAESITPRNRHTIENQLLDKINSASSPPSKPHEK